MSDGFFNNQTFVIPAKAGTHLSTAAHVERPEMDPRLRGDDEFRRGETPWL